MTELYPSPFEQPQVTVQIGHVPPHLDNPSATGVLFEASPGDFLLHLPSICSYRVEKGRRITLMPAENVHPEKVRLFLLGSVMGALFHQRNALPLHGSTIVKGENATCIVGSSASGKSTLSASLALSGFTHLADDISVFSRSGQDRFMIFPGHRMVKLWRDVADYLYPGVSFMRVRPELEKFYIPIPIQEKDYRSYRISNIMILNSRNEKDFYLEEIHGAQKVIELRNHIYRDPLIKGLGVVEHHFRQLADLAEQTKIFRLYRPQKPLLIKELKNFVIKEILD